MSEPFFADYSPEFIRWANKKYWSLDILIDDYANRTTREELSTKLQKASGWSPKEAESRIDKALEEWNKRQAIPKYENITQCSLIFSSKKR